MSDSVEGYEVELKHIEITRAVNIKVLGLNPVTNDVRISMTDVGVEVNMRPTRGDFKLGSEIINAYCVLHPDGKIYIKPRDKKPYSGVSEIKRTGGSNVRSTENL